MRFFAFGLSFFSKTNGIDEKNVIFALASGKSTDFHLK